MLVVRPGTVQARRASSARSFPRDGRSRGAQPFGDKVTVELDVEVGEDLMEVGASLFPLSEPRSRLGKHSSQCGVAAFTSFLGTSSRPGLPDFLHRECRVEQLFEIAPRRPPVPPMPRYAPRLARRRDLDRLVQGDLGVRDRPASAGRRRGAHCAPSRSVSVTLSCSSLLWSLIEFGPSGPELVVDLSASRADDEGISGSHTV